MTQRFNPPHITPALIAWNVGSLLGYGLAFWLSANYSQSPVRFSAVAVAILAAIFLAQMLLMTSMYLASQKVVEIGENKIVINNWLASLVGWRGRTFNLAQLQQLVVKPLFARRANAVGELRTRQEVIKFYIGPRYMSLDAARAIAQELAARWVNVSWEMDEPFETNQPNVVQE